MEPEDKKELSELRLKVSDLESQLRAEKATVENREQHISFLSMKRNDLQESNDIMLAQMVEIEKEVERLSTENLPLVNAKVIISNLETELTTKNQDLEQAIGDARFHANETQFFKLLCNELVEALNEINLGVSKGLNEASCQTIAMRAIDNYTKKIEP